MKETMSVNEFLDLFEQELQQMGYAKNTLISNYRPTCNRLRRYAEDNAITTFDEKLPHKFLKDHHGITVYTRGNLSNANKMAIRAVNALSDFYLYGAFQHQYIRKEPIVLSEHYQTILTEFQGHSIKQERSPAIVYRNTNMLRAFFVFLGEKGVNQCKNITPQVIHDFLDALKSYSNRTVTTNISMLKLFFKYLADMGITENNLATFLPNIRCYRASLIPSVWKKDDVERLIGAIDRGNPCGKRDLAILLLVIQMGLRAEDIRQLKLSNLKWSGNPNKSILEFSQSKTGKLLSLPIPVDVAVALIDYLKNGRPASDSKYVFLKHNAPHTPFSRNNGLNNIIFRLANRAGIQFTCDTKHGMHSLRHTFATNLIMHGVPLKIASELLGHTSVLSTDVYIKTDIPALRECALDPTEVISHEE